MPAPDGRPLVLVGRPADRIDAAVGALEQRGLAALAVHLIEPVRLPALAFASFARELGANRIDVVVFTSPYGLRFAEELATAARVEEFLDLLRARHVAAIGPRTAEALQGAGLRPGLVAAEYTSAGLARDLATRVRDRRVALLRSARGDPALVRDLAAAGAEVLDVPVYDLVLPSRTEQHAKALRAVLEDSVDAYAFTSPLTVEHFVRWIAEEKAESAARLSFARAIVAAIGPPTAEACRRAGLTPIVAREATFDALADAVAETLS